MKDLRSSSPGHRIMDECSEGEDYEAQKDCEFYESSEYKQGCVHTRKLNDFVHCSYFPKVSESS